MRYREMCLIFIVILNSILFGQVDTTYAVKVTSLESDHASICQLVTNTSKYHGEEIFVSGYLHLKFEDSALYLSKTQADYLLDEYAVWINFADSVKVEYLSKGQYEEGNIEDLKLLDCKYVRVQGVFNENHHGHFGAFAGSLEEINHIMELRQWYDGSKELLGMDEATGKIVPVEKKK